MASDIFAEAERKMNKSVDTFRTDLQSIRTGRATPALVERLPVEYYGDTMQLQQLAAIHATDARTLTIQPWDKKALGEIEKAIQKSDLGINPNNDGQAIRLILPPPTEERRKDLVKQVHKKLDEAKVAVRNVRREAHDELREQEKKKELTADELKRGTDRLQKLTDKYIDELDKVAATKEREVMEV